MEQHLTERLWWQQGVIYQIYPRSFQDSNGDGIGDLNGITARLDYLKELGIDAIWISPFYPSPMADFGYDVSDYVDVDPRFGTLADFDNLMREAHVRYIRVIIDFVPNHTSDQHAWFLESRSSRDNPKRDWYFWRDAKPDGGLPNNWLSTFGGPSWEWDQTTGQYYLHSFLKEQPDLNWRNPEVKAAMFDAIRFWLDREVDGFRIDVAHFIMKDPDLRDNPPSPTHEDAFKPMGDFASQHHIHDQGHPDIHLVYRDLREMLDTYSAAQPRCAVGEIHIFDWPKWATYYGAQLDELHMPLNFGLLFAPWNPRALRRVIDAIEAAVPPGGWPNYVLGNHDDHRVASRVGAEGARIAMMLLLTLRGTPTIYYGDEIGMHDVEIPPEMEQDPWGLNVPGMGLGRDPERTPMQWDASPNAGFSDAGVATWLPLAEDYAVINADTQGADPHSMLALTRRLLTLRRASPGLHSGGYALVDQGNEQILAYLRELAGERWLVALNFSDEQQTVNLTQFGAGRVVLSTGLDREEAAELSSLRLQGNEGCVIRLE